jgi:hypothetical protein
MSSHHPVRKFLNKEVYFGMVIDFSKFTFQKMRFSNIGFWFAIIHEHNQSGDRYYNNSSKFKIG